MVELRIASYIFFKKPIAFDTVITQWYFMSILLISFCLGVFCLKKLFSIINKFNNFKWVSKFNNNYFIATAIISFVVLSAGLSIIQNMYVGDLAIDGQEYTVTVYDNYDDAKLLCLSEKGYDRWVVGDTILCGLNITDKKLHPYKNVTVNISYTFLELVDSKISDTYCELNINKNNTFCPNIKIPIKYASNADVTIQFDERQKNPIEGLSFESITSEEYKKQRYEVFSLMFLLVSVGVFSVVSAMRNIQQMLEDPLKKEKK